MAPPKDGQKLREMKSESESCRSRLQALQEEFRKMEEMVLNLIRCKAKIDQLRHENANIKSSYEVNLVKYSSHVTTLEKDNVLLKNQLKQMDAQLHGQGGDIDKCRLLLERLKMMEAQNTSLVLENEQQRLDYERSLDEIAGQVVQAMVAQKTLRAECCKLQSRVQHLETQNQQLNVLFHHRLSSASSSPTMSSRQSPITVASGSQSAKVKPEQKSSTLIGSAHVIKVNDGLPLFDTTFNHQGSFRSNFPVIVSPIGGRHTTPNNHHQEMTRPCHLRKRRAAFLYRRSRSSDNVLLTSVKRQQRSYSNKKTDSQESSSCFLTRRRFESEKRLRKSLSADALDCYNCCRHFSIRNPQFETINQAPNFIPSCPASGSSKQETTATKSFSPDNNNEAASLLNTPTNVTSSVDDTFINADHGNVSAFTPVGRINDYHYDFSEEDSDSELTSDNNNFVVSSAASLNDLLDDSTDKEGDSSSDWSHVNTLPKNRFSCPTGKPSSATNSNNPLELTALKHCSDSEYQKVGRVPRLKTSFRQLKRPNGSLTRTVNENSIAHTKKDSEVVFTSIEILKKGEDIASQDRLFSAERLQQDEKYSNSSRKCETKTNNTSKKVNGTVFSACSRSQSPLFPSTDNDLPMSKLQADHRDTLRLKSHTFSSRDLKQCEGGAVRIKEKYTKVSSFDSKLVRPGQLILAPEEKSFSLQGFSSSGSASSEEKSPQKMFAKENLDMLSSVIEIKPERASTPTATTEENIPMRPKLDKAINSSSTQKSPTKLQTSSLKKIAFSTNPVSVVSSHISKNGTKDSVSAQYIQDKSHATSSTRLRIPNTHRIVKNNNAEKNCGEATLKHRNLNSQTESLGNGIPLTNRLLGLNGQIAGSCCLTSGVSAQSARISPDNTRVERSGSKDDGYSTMSSDVHPDVMDKFNDALARKQAPSGDHDHSGMGIRNAIPEVLHQDLRRTFSPAMSLTDRSFDLHSDPDSALETSAHSTGDMVTSSSSQMSNSSSDFPFSPSSSNVSTLIFPPVESKPLLNISGNGPRIARLEKSIGVSNSTEASVKSLLHNSSKNNSTRLYQASESHRRFDNVNTKKVQSRTENTSSISNSQSPKLSISNAGNMSSKLCQPKKGIPVAASIKRGTEFKESSVEKTSGKKINHLEIQRTPTRVAGNVPKLEEIKTANSSIKINKEIPTAQGPTAKNQFQSKIIMPNNTFKGENELKDTTTNSNSRISAQEDKHCSTVIKKKSEFLGTTIIDNSNNRSSITDTQRKEIENKDIVKSKEKSINGDYTASNPKFSVKKTHDLTSIHKNVDTFPNKHSSCVKGKTFPEVRARTDDSSTRSRSNTTKYQNGRSKTVPSVISHRTNPAPDKYLLTSDSERLRGFTGFASLDTPVQPTNSSKLTSPLHIKARPVSSAIKSQNMNQPLRLQESPKPDQHPSRIISTNGQHSARIVMTNQRFQLCSDSENMDDDKDITPDSNSHLPLYEFKKCESFDDPLISSFTKQEVFSASTCQDLLNSTLPHLSHLPLPNPSLPQLSNSKLSHLSNPTFSQLQNSTSPHLSNPTLPHLDIPNSKPSPDDPSSLIQPTPECVQDIRSSSASLHDLRVHPNNLMTFQPSNHQYSGQTTNQRKLLWNAAKHSCLCRTMSLNDLTQVQDPRFSLASMDTVMGGDNRQKSSSASEVDYSKRRSWPLDSRDIAFFSFQSYEDRVCPHHTIDANSKLSLLLSSCRNQDRLNSMKSTLFGAQFQLYPTGLFNGTENLLPNYPDIPVSIDYEGFDLEYSDPGKVVEKKEFNNQFYSICRIDSVKSVLSPQTESEERLPRKTLNTIGDGNRFHLSRKKETPRQRKKSGIEDASEATIARFDDVTKQIAELSQQVNRLSESLDSLTSEECTHPPLWSFRPSLSVSAEKVDHVNHLENYHWAEDEFILIQHNGGSFIQGTLDSPILSEDILAVEDDLPVLYNVPDLETGTLSSFVAVDDMFAQTKFDTVKENPHLRKRVENGAALTPISDTMSVPSLGDGLVYDCGMCQRMVEGTETGRVMTSGGRKCSCRMLSQEDTHHSRSRTDLQVDSEDSLASDIGLDRLMCQRFYNNEESNTSCDPLILTQNIRRPFLTNSSRSADTEHHFEPFWNNLSATPNGLHRRETTPNGAINYAVEIQLDHATDVKIPVLHHNSYGHNDFQMPIQCISLPCETRDVGIDAMSQSQISISPSLEPVRSSRLEPMTTNLNQSLQGDNYTRINHDTPTSHCLETDDLILDLAEDEPPPPALPPRQPILHHRVPPPVSEQDIPPLPPPPECLNNDIVSSPANQYQNDLHLHHPAHHYPYQQHFPHVYQPKQQRRQHQQQSQQHLPYVNQYFPSSRDFAQPRSVDHVGSQRQDSHISRNTSCSNSPRPPIPPRSPHHKPASSKLKQPSSVSQSNKKSNSLDNRRPQSFSPNPDQKSFLSTSSPSATYPGRKGQSAKLTHPHRRLSEEKSVEDTSGSKIPRRRPKLKHKIRSKSSKDKSLDPASSSSTCKQWRDIDVVEGLPMCDSSCEDNNCSS